MAQGGGPCFNLPDEILSVIPTDPYDQLDLARKLTSMAIASRVTNLETEASRLRQKLGDKDRRVQELEDKVFELETACKDAESRLRIAHEDNMKIAKERDSLALTAKKLSRDLSKLETFKKQLMQSLNDENTKTETVDIVTYDQSIPQKHSKNDKESNDCRERHSYIGPSDNGNINDNVTKQAGQRYSMTPYINPRFTPTGTPKTITSLSPRGYSAAGSPQRTPGNASPTTLYDGRGSLSSWFPSSQQSSAANSPPRGRPLQARNPRKMDGKEFFRQARSRLSLEQFSAFLANIKDLNAQKQSREETLRKAEEIFGTDNKDLYISFQGLLNRNMH